MPQYLVRMQNGDKYRISAMSPAHAAMIAKTRAGGKPGYASGQKKSTIHSVSPQQQPDYFVDKDGKRR